MGYAAHRGMKRNACRTVVIQPKGKLPLGRPRHRWEDNVKMELKEMTECMKWTDLAQDRGKWLALASAIINVRVP